MSNETITLADIFALFKESERQREAEQLLYQERQREYEERQRKHEEDMEQFRISMEETRKMVAETNKHMGSITSRWGEFVENLVRPAAVRLFKEQGINVHYTSLQVKAHDYKGSIEIDVWAENDGEIVAIEVKSHLKVRDIKRFIKVLDRFKDIFPKYKNYRLYGAVAGIKVDEKADQYALEQGLFLIRPAGDSVAIDMKEDFQAKVW